MESAQLEGIVESIIFNNPSNGYTVFSIQSSDEEIVCVGYIFALYEGENIQLSGEYVNHHVYGKQFSVKNYSKSTPTSISGIERYLSSGVIKGIGAKLAKKIVDRFGEDTFEIIEKKPAKLAELRGVTKERALLFADDYNKKIGIKNIMIFLQDFNISLNFAIKIFNLYKYESVTIIKTNPYKLADDIPGVGFKLADKIALSIGIDKFSFHRVKAGVVYSLTQLAGQGHVFVPKDRLTRYCNELLEIPDDLIEQAYIELQIDSKIKLEKTSDFEAVYLASYYYAEKNSASKLAALAYNNEAVSENEVLKTLKNLEEKSSLKLAEEQKSAVMEAVKHGVLVITGGPGTGKTTTIKTIISLFESLDKKVVLAAPTGRAAKKMTETTGKDASTIHRLLQVDAATGIDEGYQEFSKDEDNPIEGDVLIIDELSMVDILLLNNLLKAVPVGMKLVMAGDSDQLPSVGAGNVLRDIIKSQCIKVVVLDKIFRQAQESAIVMNAHRINKGEYPVINEKGSDFFFMKKNNPEEIILTIRQLVLERLPSYTKLNNLLEFQILTPMRKTQVGVNSLNQFLQETLNPPTIKKKEIELRNSVFREGDKIMQIKNNYSISWVIKDIDGDILDKGKGVYNGDTGFITAIDHELEILTVKFDDGKIVKYDFSKLDELEHAYAITVHKSQGSEYPVVIIPLYNYTSLLMTRNLLYTAVTRAKKLVVIVGSTFALQKMIDNNSEIERFSSFNVKLKKIFELYTL